MINVYTGVRHENGDVVVWKNGVRLLPGRSLAVENRSPNGFEWGYGGSGPAQLALAILLEEFDEATAVRHYQTFKHDVVAGWESSWSIDSTSIRAAIFGDQSTDQVQCRCNETCCWQEDEDGAWDTDCGGRFWLTDGGPVENKFIACPYCGARLQEKRYISPWDDQEYDS